MLFGEKHVTRGSSLQRERQAAQAAAQQQQQHLQLAPLGAGAAAASFPAGQSPPRSPRHSSAAEQLQELSLQAAAAAAGPAPVPAPAAAFQTPPASPAQLGPAGGASPPSQAASPLAQAAAALQHAGGPAAAEVGALAGPGGSPGGGSTGSGGGRPLVQPHPQHLSPPQVPAGPLQQGLARQSPLGGSEASSPEGAEHAARGGGKPGRPKWMQQLAEKAERGIKKLSK